MLQFYKFRTHKLNRLYDILKDSKKIVEMHVAINITGDDCFESCKNWLIEDITMNCTLIIYINSFGGYFWETIKFINFLKNLKLSHCIKIITVGFGYCASAATFIHSIGDIKIICRNTIYLIHNVRRLNLRTNKIISYTNYKKYYKLKIYKKMKSIYIESSNIIERELKNKLKKEYIFVKKEMISIGICDIIFYDIDTFYNLVNKYL